jgi:hypothetical protein
MVQCAEQTPGHAGPGPACGACIDNTHGSVPGHAGPGPALTDANCPIDTELRKLSIAAITVDAITICILGFISSPKFPIWDKPLLGGYLSFLTSVNLFPNINTDERTLRPDCQFGSLIRLFLKP